MRLSRRGQKGFTLIELLIVIAVLGVLAAVAIPNIAGFIVSGKLAAANSELANVQTAAVAYSSDHMGVYPTDSTEPELTQYMSGELIGSYTFNDKGNVTAADPGDWGDVLTFDTDRQQWVRASP